MHLDVLVGSAGEVLDRFIVAILGIAAEQNVGFLVGRDLLGDVAMVEVFGLGAAQIIQHALAAIVDMGRRSDLDVIAGDDAFQLGGGAGMGLYHFLGELLDRGRLGALGGELAGGDFIHVAGGGGSDKALGGRGHLGRNLAHQAGS